VLITSRNPGWGALGGRLEVDVLARAETIALLRARIPGMAEELADKLAAELGDLPLAAAQAAGYLEQTALPPADYLRRFRARRAGLLARGDVVGYSGRIDTTWALSLERLSCEDPAAVQLLQMAAFLAPEPIPLTLFTGHPELLDEPLRGIAADPDALTDTVGALVGYSLARRHADGFQLHRLLQGVIRDRLPSDRQQATAEEIVALLAAASPGDPDNPVTWPRYAALAPHVLAIASLGDSPAAARLLALDTIRYLQAHGDIHASRAVGASLLERWRSILGPDHPDTLTVATRLTLSLLGLGEVELARPIGEDTLRRCHRGLGPDHATTLLSATALSFAQAHRGEAGKARALGQDTLRRCRRELGPDHGITLMAAASLIGALLSVGETQAACALSQDTLRRCRRALGPDHVTSLLAESGLNSALIALGEAHPSRKSGEDTLQRARRVLGLEHAITLSAAATFTLALAQLGEAEPARELGQDTLQRARRVLGPDHPIIQYLTEAAGISHPMPGSDAAADHPSGPL
jgi:hypothetical protein